MNYLSMIFSLVPEDWNFSDPVAFHIGSWPVQWYGIILTTGLIIALLFFSRLAPDIKLKKDDGIDLFLYCIPLGVLFARLFYIFANLNMYFPLQNFDDFIALFYDKDGGGIMGVTILGGIFGGLLGGFLFARKRKVPFFELMGAGVVCLILGQAIGRWCNFPNQELYGGVVKAEWLQFFPVAIKIDATGNYHYAAFFYESIMSLIGFFVLWTVFKKAKYKGTVLFTYFIWYYSARFLLELTRTDSIRYIGEFEIKISMIACAFMVPLGIICVMTYAKNKGYIPWLRFLQNVTAEEYYNPKQKVVSVSTNTIVEEDSLTPDPKSAAEPKSIKVGNISAKDMAAAYKEKQEKKKP